MKTLEHFGRRAALSLIPTALIALIALSLCACTGLAEPRLVTPEEVNTSQIADRALGSVVTVLGHIPPENIQPGEGDTSSGSGFFVTPELILTNAHVLFETDRLTVRWRDGRLSPVKVQAVDEGGDLALLKLSGARAKPLAFAASSSLIPGQKLIVLGSPEGYSNSVSVGTYSSTQAIEFGNDPSTDLFGAEVPALGITSARVIPGNSGGPVLDSHGAVVGVAAAILQSGRFTSSGLGLFIPSDTARQAIADLQRYGISRRGQLGATLQDLGKLAPILRATGGLPKQGAMLLEVQSGSNAAKAKLRGARFDAKNQLEVLGDVVVSVNGKPVADAQALTLVIARYRIGDVLRLGLWRDGRTLEVKLPLTVRVK